jgi:hypothetical protein
MVPHHNLDSLDAIPLSVPSVSHPGLLSVYSCAWGVVSDFSTGRADRCACCQRSSIRKKFGQVSWKFARAFARVLSSISSIEHLSKALHRTVSVFPDSGIFQIDGAPIFCRSLVHSRVLRVCCNKEEKGRVIDLSLSHFKSDPTDMGPS